MTTPAENQGGEPEEFVPDIAIQTPFGVFTSADDLPPELRAALLHNLHDPDLPEPIRAALGKILGVDASQIDATEPDVTAGAHERHQPGCACAEMHRDEVWRLLDQAFPGDPHLWQAMHELFKISARNPVPVDDDARRASIQKATQHLQHRSHSMEPAGGPVDELIKRFRDQLGEI